MVLRAQVLIYNAYSGQGYPLSQLLLNLVAKSLPRLLLNQFQYAGCLSGIAIVGLVDRMKILQFADDTILFLNNTVGLCSRIHNYLTIFSLLTGLKINLSKSSIIIVGCEFVASIEIALE